MKRSTCGLTNFPGIAAFVVIAVLPPLACAAGSDESVASTRPAQSPIGSRTVLGNFSIDRTEVTVGQFRQKFEPKARATKAEKEGGGFEYSAGWEQRPGWNWHAPYGRAAQPSEPVVHVTWFEARDYCQSVGGDLPTFAQWRRAAYTEMRAQPTDGFEQGKTYPYPVGEEPEGMNTSDNDPWPRHAPAGETRRGVNGLYDMGANVWEWMADVNGDRAITAGASWWYGPENTREQGSQFKPRDFAVVYIGFRCAYPVQKN